LNSRLASFFPLAILALLAMLSFWLSFGVQFGSVRADGKVAHIPDLIVERFTASKLDESGNVHFSLQAENLTHFADDNSASLRNVRFHAYAKDRPPISAVAPKAELRRQESGEEEIALSGGVRLHSAKSAQVSELLIETPSALLYPDRGIARSESGVAITSVQGNVFADRFEMDTNSRRISMHNIAATLERTRN
jgi:lipopolysaccharide export system protein LptC